VPSVLPVLESVCKALVLPSSEFETSAGFTYTGHTGSIQLVVFGKNHAARNIAAIWTQMTQTRGKLLAAVKSTQGASTAVDSIFEIHGYDVVRLSAKALLKGLSGNALQPACRKVLGERKKGKK